MQILNLWKSPTTVGQDPSISSPQTSPLKIGIAGNGNPGTTRTSTGKTGVATANL